MDEHQTVRRRRALLGGFQAGFPLEGLLAERWRRHQGDQESRPPQGPDWEHSYAS
jgi:hypothetical protein